MNKTPFSSDDTARLATKAKAFLEEFGNDSSAAQKALMDAAKASRIKQKTRYRIADDAVVVMELQDVTKNYKLGRQKVEALKGMTLSVRHGEFIAITGSSGSGKSTLLQLMGGLDKASSGTLLINGQNIQKLSDRKLSVFRNKTIGFVFQFFYLQPFLRMQTNLEVPGMFARTKPRQRSKRAKDLAGAVGLEDRLTHLPSELSGGQMQRAAIARALLNNPKLLLADEPTGNLDSANSDAIIDLFEQVRRDFGTTVIVVTHDAKIAERADREIKLKDGRIVA